MKYLVAFVILLVALAGSAIGSLIVIMSGKFSNGQNLSTILVCGVLWAFLIPAAIYLLRKDWQESPAMNVVRKEHRTPISQPRIDLRA